MAVPDMAGDDDGAPCACCSTLRAHLHCAQHAARLCLPCDLRLHAAAAALGHQRAPLCDCCHAAPAAARCAVHQALLCAPCARAAGCHADRHASRPARAYTGFAKPDELSRVLFLSCDCDDDTTTPPPPPPEPAAADTWVPDLVNIELLPDLPISWHDGNITSELLSSSLIETGGKFEGPMAGSAAGDDGGDDERLFMHQDWPNLDDVVAGLDEFNFVAQDSDDLTNSFNSMGHTHTEGAFEPQASPSLGYDHPLIASYSEPIIASSDAVLESMASNNEAYHQFNSVGPANTSSNNVASSSDQLLPHAASTFYTSGVPMLPLDEFPDRHFGIEVKPPGLVVAVSSPMCGYQGQEAALQELSVPEQPSSQDMEAKTKRQEKRQEAKQRYKDKKKNRRFGKQIMYVSRKVRADTRNRVKGRFAKASSGSSGVQGDDDQSTQHEDEQPTNS